MGGGVSGAFACDVEEDAEGGGDRPEEPRGGDDEGVEAHRAADDEGEELGGGFAVEEDAGAEGADEEAGEEAGGRKVHKVFIGRRWG